jgi:branched-chain amino acid transport system ATP-binding protein
MNERVMLELRNVSKFYSGLQAVKDVSFIVPAGSITALIGPNGAGKSTAFNLISGLEPLTSGQILFADRDVTSLPPDKRSTLGLGRMFQTPRIFEYLTVVENVMVGLHGSSRSGVVRSGLRLPGARADERRMHDSAMAGLDFVGLSQFADRMAGELAFGGQRLLEFARALALSPKLLLLDEPTAGLTPAETDVFADKLRTILDRNVTILVVEHDLRFIASIAEKIIVLAHGQKIYDGAAGGIRNDTRVVEAYIGSRRERQQHA